MLSKHFLACGHRFPAPPEAQSRPAEYLKFPSGKGLFGQSRHQSARLLMRWPV